MARVWVERERFEEGRFPGLCAETGVPTEDGVELEVSRTPSWIGWLLLFSLVAYLIASGQTRERVRGFVPFDLEVARAHARTRRTAWLVALAGLAVLVGAAAASIGALAIAAGGVTGMAVLLGGLDVLRSVQARLDGSGEWVLLWRVDPRFAAAVEQQRAAEGPAPARL